MLSERLAVLLELDLLLDSLLVLACDVYFSRIFIAECYEFFL